MRLPNGYGSITKLSGNRRKPYLVRVTIGYDDAGKQIRRSIGYYAKRTEALAALTEYEARPYNIDEQKITFEQVYKAMCKLKYQKDEEPPNQYKAAYGRCFPLYNLPFRDIKTSELQQIINSCDKGYSSKKAIKIVLNLMYKYALSNDIVFKNYAALVELPAQTDSRIHRPFSLAELSTLFNNSAEDIRVQTVLILCYTGLRPTEFLKIKRENVFLDERYMLGGMKTAAGKNRIIPLADKILPFIKALYHRNNGEYLFMDDDGALSYDKYRSRYWEPVMNTFHFNHLPHDGRHTCATLMDNAGINEVIRKKILGHAGKDVTEKVYTHKSVSQLVEAINKI